MFESMRALNADTCGYCFDLVSMSDSEMISSTLAIGGKGHKKSKKEEVNEELLETIVFGKESNVLENISKKSKQKEVSETNLIIEDRSGSPKRFSVTHDGDEDSDDSDSSEDINYSKTDLFSNLNDDEVSEEKEETSSAKKSVWADSDDLIAASEAFSRKLPKRVAKEDNYRSYLENKFNDLYKRPKWALKTNKDTKDSSESEDSDDDDISRTARNFKVKSDVLDKGILRLKKCTDLTHDNHKKTSLNCVEFHPTSTVGMVSSPNGTVRLFQVDGKVNARLQTVKFKDFRIDCARFSRNGDELIIGSKRDSGYYYYYDMIAARIVKIPYFIGKEKFCLDKFVLSNDQKYIASRGKNGFINILTAKTKEHVFDLKMNGEVMSMSFTDDSNMLFSHGNCGKVYIWDIRKRQCVNRFTDEGCIAGTAITLSPNSEYCCTGSDMGVVNVYKMNDVLNKAEPKPLKSLMNLTTEISHLKFNHSSELLVMSSNAKDNSIKCVHMNSLTVFSNFPDQNKNYGRIHESDISLNSGYFTFATNGGVAHLFRLTHFSNY